MRDKAKPASAYRTIVEKALDSEEWEKAGIDGKNHGILRHIPTGETTTYALGFDSGSDVNGVRNTAKDIEKISGVKVWVRGSRKPSKKRIRGSGYNPYAEHSDLEESASKLIGTLLEELKQVDRALRSVDRTSRAEFNRVQSLVAKRVDIAADLQRLHYPAPELRLETE